MNTFFLACVFNIIAVGVWFYNVMNTNEWFFSGLSIEGVLFLVFSTASIFCLLIVFRETSSIHRIKEQKFK